jgi:hypothetical protein
MISKRGLTHLDLGQCLAGHVRCGSGTGAAILP